MAFLYVMSYLRISQSAAEWLIGLEMSKWALLFWVNIRCWRWASSRRRAIILMVTW